MIRRDGKRLFATERLYLNREQNQAVREGDPKAAFLLAGTGAEIPTRFSHLFEVVPPVEPTPAPVVGTEPERRSTRPARARHTR